MKFITRAQLQREYGLSFKTADRVIREQSALTRHHYRFWYASIRIGLYMALACTFAPNHSLMYRIGGYATLLAVLCIGIMEMLIKRRAHVPILATACAANTVAVHAG